MRARINLASYPARVRRRVAGRLLSAVVIATALTAAHLVWANAPGASADQVRGEAGLLEREADVLQARLDELRTALDPAAVEALADRVATGNELIARAAVDPIELLALLEAQAPRGLVVERMHLTGAPEGLQAELTLRVTSQEQALELIRRLRDADAVREVTPVREQVSATGGQMVVSLLYRPDAVDPEEAR